MSDLSLQRVGPTFGGQGTASPFRADTTGAQCVTDAHLRLLEANMRGNLYTFGLTDTALVAANAVATGVTSTAQPIVGLWNPPTSLVNLVLYKVHAFSSTIAGTAVSPAGFVWLVSTGQSAITAGSTPFNCKTLAQSGSFAKAFALSTALTGLSGSLVSMRGCPIASINAAGPATAITQPIAPIEEILDGCIIVPPGGVLALMNKTSTTTVSLNVGITWEEVPTTL